MLEGQTAMFGFFFEFFAEILKTSREEIIIFRYKINRKNNRQFNLVSLILNMESKEYELIVSQKKNPIWKIIISGLFFGFAIIAIIDIFSMQHYSDFTQEESNIFIKNIVVAMICTIGGIYSSVRLTILIDVDKDKLVSRYFLGFFTIERLTNIPELQYVAVTKNKDDIYLIDLLYDDYQSFNMCYSEDKDASLKFAQEIALKLNLDTLDATESGNHKWVKKI